MAIPKNFTAGERLFAADLNDNFEDLDTRAEAVADALDAAGVPAGTVIYHAADTAPTGFVKANGAALNRTTFVGLFAAIGTVFGAGNGTTTFNVPDLRAEFVRGFDDGRAVDTGRSFGSFQDHAVQRHTHTHNEAYNRNAFGAGASADNRVAETSNDGTEGNFASETRPRNVALLACIKF